MVKDKMEKSILIKSGVCNIFIQALRIVAASNEKRVLRKCFFHLNLILGGLKVEFILVELDYVLVVIFPSSTSCCLSQFHKQLFHLACHWQKRVSRIFGHMWVNQKYCGWRFCSHKKEAPGRLKVTWPDLSKLEVLGCFFFFFRNSMTIMRRQCQQATSVLNHSIICLSAAYGSRLTCSSFSQSAHLTQITL